jgi:hypothetical protein
MKRERSQRKVKLTSLMELKRMEMITKLMAIITLKILPKRLSRNH